MTITPTYPGVYITEVPSGSRTVTGVATALAAFVGVAPRGPVDEPVPISSFSEFERRFGGLWRGSGMGYAVRDFYLNGGGPAIVVRDCDHVPGAAAAVVAQARDRAVHGRVVARYCAAQPPPASGRRHRAGGRFCSRRWSERRCM